MGRDSKKLTGILEDMTEKKVSAKAPKPSIEEFKKESKVVQDSLLSPAEELRLELEKERQKPTMEESHVRTTFLLRKDLQRRLDALSDVQGRGFKTKFLNMAIEALLDDWEKEE
ncbi:hypothetical protein MXL49_16640 [Enterococcus casseliflavus]|uniref:hypothetical protein n=1 Tax=Enterococcus casseliflavus TaxID=37734 RepID=UPI002DB949DB|nr:hypothetical protein [Enterococcus casseliflavus]MEB6213510.1 hypothetical protein [Enterococcus casseliflavus]